MDINTTGGAKVNWAQLLQNQVQWRPVVNTIRNPVWAFILSKC